MGFLSNLVGSVVKTALTPVAVVADTVKVVSGESADVTKQNTKDALEDLRKALEDLTEGDLE